MCGKTPKKADNSWVLLCFIYENSMAFFFVIKATCRELRVTFIAKKIKIILKAIQYPFPKPVLNFDIIPFMLNFFLINSYFFCFIPQNNFLPF